MPCVNLPRLNHEGRAKFKLYRRYFRDLPPGKICKVFCEMQ
ncbi:hypothetical protein CAMRE0001_3210 [Campylobacter rectus RM3267]|uniref:Uncharacterized protein n=1 Tax=Campylobacter rectus RM3267 TaxID=553218 RepID=B9D1C3_CAMRE|nr:hypothetical protein CAMRE0001_3210 [Campylobacter rectus RM3267]